MKSTQMDFHDLWLQYDRYQLELLTFCSQCCSQEKQENISLISSQNLVSFDYDQFFQDIIQKNKNQQNLHDQNEEQYEQKDEQYIPHQQNHLKTEYSDKKYTYLKDFFKKFTNMLIQMLKEKKLQNFIPQKKIKKQDIPTLLSKPKVKQVFLKCVEERYFSRQIMRSKMDNRKVKKYLKTIISFMDDYHQSLLSKK